MNDEKSPTPAPTDARWLSPETRECAKFLVNNEDVKRLLEHAQLMDERLQQTWLAFTAERDLHNAAKKEIAAKDREIAELRRDRGRLKKMIELGITEEDIHQTLTPKP